MSISKSLGDFIVDRTESLNDELIKKYFIDCNEKIISRLLDSEQYILEGSRGIGKTMLMKKAVLYSKDNFGKDSVLAVWISFEESLRIERIRIVNNNIDPFLQWTMGKILYEVLKQIINLKPNCSDKLSQRLNTIFNHTSMDSTVQSFESYTDILREYISLLEKGDIDNNGVLSTVTPSNKLSQILDNPSSFKEFLTSLINDFALSRIVLLFDEAAHVFSHSQQSKFFTLFKSLRAPGIACKAAVYPGITNYGKYFEKGQDAKELRVKWNPNNKNDLKYIKNIIKARIKEFDIAYWNKLCNKSEIIDTICICSNGNPRFAFHIIDELDNEKAFLKTNITLQTVINCIRRVFNNKWNEFNTLQKRLVKYKIFIIEAEIFMKNTIIPKLRVWNINRRKANKKLSAGFYIETNTYDKIPKIFDILAYYNIVTIDYSKKSIGHNFFGYYVSLNPSILFSDSIVRNVTEMLDISVAIENNQAYYQTSDSIQQLISSSRIENEYRCSSNKCNFSTNQEFSYCPQCGNKIIIEEPESLYKILRSHGLENLKLGVRLIKRLKEKFNNIGEIYDAELDDIRMKYVQDVRIEKVKNAAIEYMAG